MSANSREQTPFDARTNLPLPILPFQESKETSWHHHAHPSDSPLLKKAGGLVVRTVRLQLAEGRGGMASINGRGNIKKKYGEHQRYHYFYEGPPLPETPEDQFNYAVWAASGYIPENALDITGREPKEVRMNPKQVTRLREDEIRIGSKQLLKDFLKDHIFDQDLSHINDSIVDEFVSTKDWERKKFLGHWLLSQAAEVATAPIADNYREAHKLGLISSRATTKVSNVVHGAIIRPTRQQQSIIQQLEHRFAA